MFCGISTVTTRVQMLSFGNDTAPQSFCHLFVALSMICYSNSAQKSAVQVCKVATVVMETTHSWFSANLNTFIIHNAELNKVYLCQK